ADADHGAPVELLLPPLRVLHGRRPHLRDDDLRLLPGSERDRSPAAILAVVLLTGRVAIVTGAAQGIGRAIATRLAGEGARVMIADVNQVAAEATGAELRARGATVAVHSIDLQRVDDIPGLVERTVDALGGLDILVNNAGVEFGGAFFDV